MTNQWKDHDKERMTMVSDKCCEWWQGVHSSLSVGLGCFRVAAVGACWPNLQVTTIPRSKYDDSYSFLTGPLTFQWGHSSSKNLIHQQDVAGNHRAVREIIGLLKLMRKKRTTSTPSKCQKLPWMKELFLDAVIVPHTCFSCHHGLSWKSDKNVLVAETQGFSTASNNAYGMLILLIMCVCMQRFRPVLRSTPTSWPDSLYSVCSFNSVSCGS